MDTNIIIIRQRAASKVATYRVRVSSVLTVHSTIEDWEHKGLRMTEARSVIKFKNTIFTNNEIVCYTDTVTSYELEVMYVTANVK